LWEGRGVGFLLSRNTAAVWNQTDFDYTLKSLEHPPLLSWTSLHSITLSVPSQFEISPFLKQCRCVLEVASVQFAHSLTNIYLQRDKVFVKT